MKPFIDTGLWDLRLFQPDFEDAGILTPQDGLF